MKGINMNMTITILVIVMMIIAIALVFQYGCKTSGSSPNEKKDELNVSVDVPAESNEIIIMTDSNSFVGYIERFNPGKEQWLNKRERKLPNIIKVKFDVGRTGILEMNSPRMRHWSNMMENQERSGKPVYVEIDPQSEVIMNLLIPRKLKVQNFQTNENGDMVFFLSPSAAGHFLLRSNPDFNKLSAILQDAMQNDVELFITETRDEHEIIDVRVVSGG